MKSELEKKILEKYPEFFEYLKDYKGPLMPIYFGFEHGDGWYFIIDSLMSTIKNIIMNYNEYNKEEGEPEMTIQLHQVKEKFGTLSFYVGMGGGSDRVVNEIYGAIHLAEQQSSMVCELCGTTENVGTTSGWITTCCEKCFNEKTNSINWISPDGNEITKK
jgi:hypothetical protein